jgi:cytochrome c biogenesis protein CcmG, thiol:disulfide interchange protein DsbE
MNWKRSLIGAGVALPLVALLGFGLTRDPRAIPSPLPGRAAPDFALSVIRRGDLSEAATADVGDTVRLAGLRGQVVVLNFWASWCLACRAEHGVLSSAASAYAGRPVRFIGVLYQDSPDNGRAWIQEMGGQTYSAVNDPGSRTAIDYGLYGVPETFFIGPDGRVTYKHIGPVTEGVLTAHIDSLLAAAPDSAGGNP